MYREDIGKISRHRQFIINTNKLTSHIILHITLQLNTLVTLM